MFWIGRNRLLRGRFVDGMPLGACSAFLLRFIVPPTEEPHWPPSTFLNLEFLMARLLYITIFEMGLGEKVSAGAAATQWVLKNELS